MGGASDLFEITIDDDKTGTWAKVSGGEDPTHLIVKAGPSFALYRIIDGDGDIWTTEALRNPGGQQPALSHLSFYFSPGLVPEAQVLTLLGLAGMAFVLFRRTARTAR